MNSQTKICQNCKQQFIIEPEDFKFYDKIKVPPPTFCPECRLQRRFTWRNERTLYKRKCDLCNKEVVSIFSQSKNLKVYCQKCWYSDKWDSLTYGQNYNFEKSFFEQFRELISKSPLLSLFNGNAINSEYCNHASNHKNCYLVTGAVKNENIAYANRINLCKDSLDLYIVNKSELCYENIYCENSYKLFFSKESINCTDSAFLYNCKNCSYCFCSTNLRNKQYYIFNQSYSKTEYQEKIKEFDLGSYKNILQIKKKFQQIYYRSFHRYANILKSVNVLGDHISKTKNCYYCFDVFDDVENCKYINWGGFQLRNSYDAAPGNGWQAELAYESIDTGLSTYLTLFTISVWGSYHIQYAYNCQNSSNLFACIGLRHKQYCILNKQYSKEEYERMVPKIIEHMNSMPYIDKKDRVYKYGEFFPPELSPFSYNETIAQEYFPSTKEQAIANGYSWKDPEERNYQITMKTQDIPDNIKDVDDSILDEVIECLHNQQCQENCTQAFRPIKPELEFLRKMNLPLPRLCPNCRHYQRTKQRNPLKLWHRKCQCNGKTSDPSTRRSPRFAGEAGFAPRSGNNAYVYQNTAQHFHQDKPCPNEFETTYSPERPEIIYCEKCYLAEVV